MEMKVKDKLVESLDSDDFVNASIHSLEDESAIMFRFSKCGLPPAFPLACCASNGCHSFFVVVYTCFVVVS